MVVADPGGALLASVVLVEKDFDAEFASWVGGLARIPHAINAADRGVSAFPSPCVYAACVVLGQVEVGAV